jgi:hypothetical protein
VLVWRGVKARWAGESTHLKSRLFGNYQVHVIALGEARLVRDEVSGAAQERQRRADTQQGKVSALHTQHMRVATQQQPCALES